MVRLNLNKRIDNIPGSEIAPTTGMPRTPEIIGVDIIGTTGLGTGTTKTQLGGADYVLPEWARQIVAVRPYATIDVPTVSESVLTKLTLESEDFVISPYEVLAAPISSHLGATSVPFVPKIETYQVNCPVQGGGKLKAYGTALVANTAAPNMGCVVIMSSRPPTERQLFAKMGTLTATGTTASTEVAGTQYSFSKGSEIVELFGAYVPDTLAAAEGVCGYLRFESSEFAAPVPLKMAFQPQVGLITAGAANIDGVSRQEVKVSLRPGQANIQDYFLMDLAPAAAGNFVTGVMVRI